MSWYMLYRQEKHFSKKAATNQAKLATAQIACVYLLLDGL
jgi:hypothetical protein